MIFRDKVYGTLTVSPQLEVRHATYLGRFREINHVKRDPKLIESKAKPDPIRLAVGLPVGPQGAYYVGDAGWSGTPDESVVDDSTPPRGQPTCRCNWSPTEDRCGLVLPHGDATDGVAWLRYLIKHFLQPWGYTVSGKAFWVPTYGSRRGPSGRLLDVRANHPRVRLAGRYRFRFVIPDSYVEPALFTASTLEQILRERAAGDALRDSSTCRGEEAAPAPVLENAI